MTVNHEIKDWLKSRPVAPIPQSLSELRLQVNHDIIQQQGIEQDAGYQSSFQVKVADQTQIEARSYIPDQLQHQQQRPALVFAHGGGWCLGSLDAWDRACRLLADSTQLVVFSVDYRLAPEFKFPIPLTDFFCAFRHIYHNALTLGIDPNRIAVGGDSAGANLAAVTCLLAKQHPEIQISHQLLFYPALDATMNSPSYTTYAEDFGLTTATMAYCWDQYLNNESERNDERANPLLAKSLQGLPAATIFACEYDPVRDDAERYAERLKNAGIDVKLHLLTGMIHGAIHMNAITPEARKIYQKIELAINKG